MLELKLLLLLFTANSAPIIAMHLLGERYNCPVDGGLTLSDGTPLFGSSKTWRGIIFALVLTPVVAYFCLLPVTAGLLFGATAMVGDLLASFVKRRMHKPPSSRAVMLDQIPESLFPLICGSWLLNYNWVTVIGVTVAFIVIEIFASPLLFKMGLRKKPY